MPRRDLVGMEFYVRVGEKWTEEKGWAQMGLSQGMTACSEQPQVRSDQMRAKDSGDVAPDGDSDGSS